MNRLLMLMLEAALAALVGELARDAYRSIRRR